jgi:WD40 repeat protein
MKQAISGTENGNIFVWNFKPQMRPFKFSQHKGAITDLAINPLGDIIASSSTDHTVRLWTNAVGGKNKILKCHPSPIRSVDFSSDGKFLMTGSNDKTIKIFELYPKHKFISSYKGHSNWVRCARFSPDNRLIGSCGDDNAVIIFDVEQKSVNYRFLDHTSNVNSCRFSPDGTIIASAGDDGKIKLFDIRMGRLIQHYDAHNDKINCISYHQSGNYIISGSDDSTIKIWDLKMGQILYTVHGHRGKVKSVNFNIDGDYFCSGGEDSIVMVWKSNIKNMDEEYNTLSKARMQNYTMSNKTKINLEESKQTADKNYLNNIKLKLEGGENIIKPAKIPNKAFGMRYKVTLEKGVKDIFNLNQNNTKNSNMNNTNIISNNNVNISSKNNIAYSNSNMNSKNNVVIEVSENPMNDSSMMLNPNLNPFSKLPTEMASAFDKMIHQFEIISKTVKIMDQRIATAESQIEGLYGMRKIQNELNNDNNEQEYIPPIDENINNNNNNYIGDNQYNKNYNENINENNNIVANNEQMVENNYINNEVVDNNNNINENNNEIIEQNENNNQIIENDINQNQINDNMISTNNNIINNINKNMTANFNGTITGLQASIGDLDINVNDAKNIFNQNLGNTNLNMENHEEINQNLNSNVNPIGSGEIVSEKQEVLNDVENNENNNENQEENK